MVIVYLKGGLGNQMFQYATARRIAHKNCAPFKLDISWYSGIGKDTQRSYQLSNFNIMDDFASSQEIESFKPSSRLAKMLTKVKGKLVLNNRHLVREKSPYFDSKILSISGDIYLEGNWGSEKYFLDIRDILKKEFTLRESLDEDNQKTASEIRAVTSVSVHVRRGDFAINPVTKQFHGLCSIHYYRRAVEEMACYLDKPHFFVFSDDYRWVKENLKLGYPTTFVRHNDTGRGHEDLRLMSLCKHNIIANSTFSWWGAWLNNNADKRVIAPIRWINREDFDTGDLLPDSWIKL